MFIGIGDVYHDRRCLLQQEVSIATRGVHPNAAITTRGVYCDRRGTSQCSYRDRRCLSRHVLSSPMWISRHVVSIATRGVYRDRRCLSRQALALLLLLPGLGRRLLPMAAMGTAGDTGGGTGSGANSTGSDAGDTGSGPAYVPGSVSAAFVTCPNQGVAIELARAVVQQRLAACVNIVPGVTSVYTWQGKLEEDSEVLLVIKTRSSRVPALTEFIRSHHPYEVPEVVALPVAQGNLPYLRWVGDAVPP